MPKMELALFFVLLVAAAEGAFNAKLNDCWKFYKKTFQKNYSTPDNDYRRGIWEARASDIARYNLNADLGMTKFRKGLNQFTDMKHRDFVEIHNGYNRPQHFRTRGYSYYKSNVSIPDAIDWRDYGYISPVKDQGTCGSCWTYSTTGAMEAQQYKRSGQMTLLSEQNLLDCSRKNGNQGCNGGWMDQAFQYIINNGGIQTEESYPYTGIEGNCMFDPNYIGATLTAYVDIPKGDEDALKEAVALNGPVTVAIDASQEAFMSYREGIYEAEDCSSEELDHAVLVVGYGTDDGDDYWLVKNSWGTTWGDKGYFKIARNRNNMCGIATEAQYPLP